jgi:hypothetical protein
MRTCKCTGDANLVMSGVFIVPQTVCTAEHFWCKELNSSLGFRKMCYLKQVTKHLHMKET